jgi:hypothetical protein
MGNCKTQRNHHQGGEQSVEKMSENSIGILKKISESISIQKKNLLYFL